MIPYRALRHVEERGKKSIYTEVVRPRYPRKKCLEEEDEEAGGEEEEEVAEEGQRGFREISVVMGRSGDKSLHPARSESAG